MSPYLKHLLVAGVNILIGVGSVKVIAHYSQSTSSPPMAVDTLRTVPVPIVKDTLDLKQLEQQLNNEVKEIEFATNSAKISGRKAFVKLKQLSELSEKNDSLYIGIHGFTDNKGKADSNLVLSRKRAEAVKYLLISTYNLDSNKHKIEAIGHGESEPVATNATEEGRRQNRRVIFELKFLRSLGKNFLPYFLQPSKIKPVKPSKHKPGKNDIKSTNDSTQDKILIVPQRPAVVKDTNPKSTDK